MVIEISSDVCHFIIGGLIIAILGLSGMILRLENKDKNREDQLDKTNKMLMNLMVKIIEKGNNKNVVNKT